jgi:hypothetical protein
MAAAVSWAIIVAAARPAAAEPPAEPANAEQRGPLPPDFVTLTDDTGTISVGVPASWTDVDTAPAGNDPWISATPDFLDFVSTFDVPGVILEAVAFTTDTDALALEFGFADECDGEELLPYDDGVFVGTELIETGCGDVGAAEHHVIAANPSSQAFTLLLEAQITGPDQAPILDAIKATFGVASHAGTVASSIAATTVLRPSGVVPADWTRLNDDTGTISIAVPSAWTLVDTGPSQNVDGTPQPWISATTDSFVPRVIYRAYPPGGLTPELLDWSRFDGLCTPEPLQRYNDGDFVGYVQSFDACGGAGAARIVEVMAIPRAGSFTAYLVISLLGNADDAATLDGLLSSFGDASVPTAPTTTPGRR